MLQMTPDLISEEDQEEYDRHVHEVCQSFEHIKACFYSPNIRAFSLDLQKKQFLPRYRVKHGNNAPAIAQCPRPAISNNTLVETTSTICNLKNNFVQHDKVYNIIAPTPPMARNGMMVAMRVFFNHTEPAH